MGTFLQAEVLQFVPRLSVTRDNENILRRATFTELKFNATTVKIMRPFIDIYKIVILVAGCFLRLLLYYYNFLESPITSSGTYNEYDNDDTCR